MAGQPGHLQQLPDPILENLAKYLGGSCRMRLVRALQTVCGHRNPFGQATPTRSWQRLLNSLQWGAVESATTVLQSLVRAHLTCHVLRGVSRSQRLACLRTYLRLQTVRRLLSVGIMLEAQCPEEQYCEDSVSVVGRCDLNQGDYSEDLPWGLEGRLILAALGRHSPMQLHVWYAQLGQRGIETPRYQRVAEEVWPAVESFELRLQSLVLEELRQGVQLSGHFSGVGHFS
jgi:hypothetical protein